MKLFSSLSKTIIVYKSILIVVLLFIVVTISLYREFMTDDAFIHIGFAKDIHEGKGYSFAGNRTYGSTSPIWPVLIATLAYTHIDFEYAAQLLSLLFSIAAVSLMYFTARLRFGNLISLSAAILFAFNAYFLRWSVTGMEATASCFFMLVLIYIYFQEKDNQVNKYLYFIAGLSPLIRPEFYLFLPILFLFLKGPVKQLIFKLVLAVIPATLWNCFTYIYFGTITPSTFLIKAGNSLFSTEWDTILRSTLLFLSGNPIEFCFILVASALLILRNKKTFREFVRSILLSEISLFIACIFLFYLYYILKNVTILSRYSLVLLPAIILATLLILSKLSEQNHFSSRTTSFILALLVSFSLIAQISFTCFIVKPDADTFVNGFQREYKRIALMIAAEGHRESSVALSDVGIIGVYSKSKIYDFVGLVDKDRFQFASKRDYFLNKKPHYLISRGEISLEELKDTASEFQEIYSTQIAGLGINQQRDYKVKAYRVLWGK